MVLNNAMPTANLNLKGNIQSVMYLKFYTEIFMTICWLVLSSEKLAVMFCADVTGRHLPTHLQWSLIEE